VPAPFRYKHSGSLAQIGKRKAVIDFGRFKLHGAIAWWIWGIAHIYFLIGLRNRLSVALSWLWIHARDQRAPRLITEIASRYGSQATVLSVDARPAGDGRWEVVLDGGRVPTGMDALTWVREGVSRGAGEVLLNSIDHDGTKRGFDLALTAAVASTVDVPVIASGGASSAADFVELFRTTGAEAGLAASIFHYGLLTVGAVKDALAAAGIPVRPPERAFA